MHFSWQAQFSRVCIGDPPPYEAECSFTFGSILKSELKGTYISDIRIPLPFERVIDLYFSQRLAEPPVWTLKSEIMGARSNLLLLSYPDKIIQACAYQVSSSSSIRPIQIQTIYENPPVGGGIISPYHIHDISEFKAILNQVFITNNS